MWWPSNRSCRADERTWVRHRLADRVAPCALGLGVAVARGSFLVRHSSFCAAARHEKIHDAPRGALFCAVRAGRCRRDVVPAGYGCHHGAQRGLLDCGPFATGLGSVHRDLDKHGGPRVQRPLDATCTSAGSALIHSAVTNAVAGSHELIRFCGPDGREPRCLALARDCKESVGSCVRISTVAPVRIDSGNILLQPGATVVGTRLRFDRGRHVRVGVLCRRCSRNGNDPVRAINLHADVRR
mmetsp:Transcript_118706/g.335779  ORF Transcript_118706/g.335779 Transcript_118706/m.335779 type:complete len:241 (-) Transcript_118706:86-808(-)